MRWTLCIALALAACDSGAPSCEDALAKALHADDELTAAIRRQLIDRCTAQTWSVEVRTCLLHASTTEATDTCLRRLTPEQLSTITDQLEAPGPRLQRPLLEAERARKEVADLAAQMDAMNARVGAAIDVVASAPSDAERSRAQQVLADVRRAKADLEARFTAARAAARAERLRSQECIDNPLAKNCQ